jgi:hypothetical protein
MLSGKLVQTIESHWQDIARRVISKLHRHPETPRLAGRSDAEIRGWCEDILSNLGGWLVIGSSEDARRHFEAGGGARFHEDIPLHEAVLRLQILKESVIDFVHEEWFPADTMQLYAEEELERRVSRFFDSLVYYVVYGYEKAGQFAAGVP